MTHPASADAPTRLALPRELAGFLIDLAIALQNFGVYPPGHPFLARSAENVVRRIDGVLHDRATLAFGVARNQLVIEGVATDPANPVLAGLAGRLHRHRIGAITLARGIDMAETARLLTLLAAEPESGASESVLATQLPHSRLHPLCYGHLELTGDVGDGPPQDSAPRAAQLWIGLARAAVASDEEQGTDAAVVAHAINTRPAAAAYDQVIVGYLLQLADELRKGDGPGAADIRRRLAQTVQGLRPEALRRLVEMGGDVAQRRRFLLDASYGFAADAVVRLVEAAAEADGQVISQPMLRVLTKLAAHTDAVTAPTSAAADVELRGQIHSLVRGWSLAEANPGGYDATLERLSHTELGPGALRPATFPPEAERVLQTALELDADGHGTGAALQRMLAEGRAVEVVALLDGAPPESALADRLWAAAATPETLRQLLDAGLGAAPATDRLVERMGEAAIPALLDQLDSDSRVVRRAVLARLVRLGPPAAVQAARRLGDPNWYLLRNLLLVIGEAGVPEDFDPGPFLRHEDARVRREAFRVALRMPARRVRAVTLALADADSQVRHAGLAECMRDPPPAAVPFICRHATDPEAGSELRLLAVRALREVREGGALHTLLHLTQRTPTLLRRRRLAPPSAEMTAALQVLAVAWGGHPQAEPVLALARRSPDAAVLKAVVPQRTDP